MSGEKPMVDGGLFFSVIPSLSLSLSLPYPYTRPMFPRFGVLGSRTLKRQSTESVSAVWRRCSLSLHLQSDPSFIFHQDRCQLKQDESRPLEESGWMVSDWSSMHQVHPDNLVFIGKVMEKGLKHGGKSIPMMSNREREREREACNRGRRGCSSNWAAGKYFD